jgi:hypothetical protein
MHVREGVQRFVSRRMRYALGCCSFWAEVCLQPCERADNVLSSLPSEERDGTSLHAAPDSGGGVGRP